MDEAQKPEGTPDAIGRRLKAAREYRGLSVRGLARTSQVPHTTIADVESGRREGGNLKTKHMRRLVMALGISADWLIDWSLSDDAEASAPPSLEAGLLLVPGGLTQQVEAKLDEILTRLAEHGRPQLGV